MSRWKQKKEEEDAKNEIRHAKLTTREVLKNLVIMIPSFYIIFYSVSSIVHATFGLEKFDIKSPFNFKECCWENSKQQVSAISLLGTCLISTLLFVLVTSHRLWDHMITLIVFHILTSALVMLEFPMNWQWWIAILVGLSLMVSLGELLAFLMQRREKRKMQDIVQNNIST